MKSEQYPLALYVHIPFCVRKCLYCDFHSQPGTEVQQRQYVSYLTREIQAWGMLLGGRYIIKSVFLGGGTPSCLPVPLLVQISDAIRKSFFIQKDAEYTIEANPGTLTKEHLHVFHKIGINRISLGVQSAQDTELKALGRIHTYQGFLEAYGMLREEGFDNINVDLMAAIPGQTEESYRDTLEKIIVTGPEHISAYSLIIEPGTSFYEMEQKGLLCCPDEEADRRMYEYTEWYLSRYGYRRYEISNYAREGKECKHNIVYWTGGEYLGVGENASSYLHGYRFRVPEERERYKAYVERLAKTATEDKTISHMKNRLTREDGPHGKSFAEQMKNVSATEESLKQGLPLQRIDLEKEDWLDRVDLFLDEKNRLSLKEQMEEFMFLGLRMIKGVSVAEFWERFGKEIDDVYGSVISKHLQNKLLTRSPDGSRIALTKRGIDVSNYVLADFL